MHICMSLHGTPNGNINNNRHAQAYKVIDTEALQIIVATAAPRDECCHADGCRALLTRQLLLLLLAPSAPPVHQYVRALTRGTFTPGSVPEGTLVEVLS
eukprot:SAG11_NODE_3161_length_2642_cov_2.388124_1_plen_99_part_00